MTHVDRSPVRREVRTLAGAALVVHLTPEGFVFNEKRRRAKFALPYGVAYQVAVATQVAAERAAKGKTRKVKRGKL